MENKRIALVGFGLLAGSVAAAVKQAGLPIVIRAVSSRDTLKKAEEQGVATEYFEYEEVEKWLPEADLVLLCSPIKHILSQIEILKKNVHLCAKKVVVSDIGSTKEEICSLGFELPEPFCFVGGHPMAGSEKRGFEHGDPSIFENAYWLYCLPKNLTELPEIMSELLHFLGSRPVQISPSEHDYAMAWLSHAPQLLSTAIASGVSSDVLNNYLHLAGRGFRDMTRIAGSSWGMWKDILKSNKENVSKALSSYANTAIAIKNFLDNEPEKIEEEFLRGNKMRHSLETGKNYAYPLFEIVVNIPDVSGSILNALAPLAEENISVRDVELMKVREGIGGTLLLAFRAESEATDAIKILEGKGIHAKRRI